MSIEWFDRVCGELQDQLESICEKYDQIGHMSIDRGAKHPRIEFYVETEDDERDYFCTLFFDPHNEDFYIETFDFEYEQTTRTILSDIEDIVDAIHDSFHYYLNDDIEDDVENDYEYVEEENTEFLEEIDVEWETPEVTAFIYKDEVEVTYQFGVVQETGDGVLRRINRIRTNEDDIIKDETNFIFSKEEASTIIAMIASHMDSLSEFDLQ
ncbi:hypothetical protein [uncultured Metabacillus sp.]|uniref:hypothetical protein n=1 Tax=uncultured Metabacillus sp. TaxID=2860135 RepID=UPI002623EECF|nr:hypothetical protein [uncultured Metabacillus sp.]